MVFPSSFALSVSFIVILPTGYFGFVASAGLWVVSHPLNLYPSLVNPFAFKPKLSPDSPSDGSILPVPPLAL